MRRFLNEFGLWLECWTGWLGMVLLALVAIATLPLWIFFADRVALLGQRLEAWARQRDKEHAAEWDALAGDDESNGAV